MPDSNEGTASHTSTNKLRSPQRRKEQRPLKFIPPSELPELTPEVSRILLAMLIDRTDGTDWQKHLHKYEKVEPQNEQ